MIVRVSNHVGYHIGNGKTYLFGLDKYVKEPYTEISFDDYGDNKTEKVCNICHTIQPVGNFQKNQNGKDNRTVRRPSCNDCRKEIDGIGMKASDKKLWKKPEIFTCPICEKNTIPGLTSKIVLNHDHKTGKITGWLCDSCNTGLGRFQDSQRILRNAIMYLKKHIGEES